MKEKRHRFLSRAATANWDAIIITHSAFRFIPAASAFEQQMVQDELQAYEDLLAKVDCEDRLSRKRIERMKEGRQERLEALSTRKDDLLTAARARAAGQAGEFVHWAKVAAEVARISPRSPMDIAVVQAIVDDETRRGGASRSHDD